MRDLGARVEVLENSVLEANKDLEALWTIVRAIQTNGYVSKIIQNNDGSFTITTTYYTDANDPNSKTTRTDTLRPGTDGKEAKLVIGVAQDPLDGVWYWTLNGDWVRDANNDRMRAGAQDGKNGQDGIIPKWEIADDGTWKISFDDGQTWTNTGKAANGKDGKDGEDGDPDIFEYVRLSENGQYLIIKVRGQDDPIKLPIQTVTQTS